MAKPYLSYFLGRLNPPHGGHIDAIVALILEAREHRNPYIPPLILLGSGPKRQQTLDDPLTFELKCDFIVTKLAERGFVQDQDYIIQEIGNPSMDIANYVKTQLVPLINSGEPIETIDIIHIAGEKGDDTTKLDFLKKSASNALTEIGLGAVPTIIATVAIRAVASANGSSAMSATEVRQDVLRLSMEDWMEKYGTFYGRHSHAIYEAIKHVAHSEPYTDEDRAYYIENGEIRKVSKRKRTGGSKRRKRRGKRTHKRKLRSTRHKTTRHKSIRHKTTRHK